MFRRQLILFSILLIIATTFLSLNERVKLQLAAPLSSVLLLPVKTITQFLQFLTVSNTRITKLETVVSQLQLENAELKKRLLRDTTELKTTKYKLLRTQIIGRDPSNINGYLYIATGQRQKLYVNQPAISINGLVGKIKYVGFNYSIVETIENKGFTVSAIDVNTGIHGIVKNKGNLIFDFIKINDAINIGDAVYTSGMSEIFPEGIFIGRVKKIERGDDLFFKPVYITPGVQINRLTHVYIISGSTITANNEYKEQYNYKEQSDTELFVPGSGR